MSVTRRVPRTIGAEATDDGRWDETASAWHAGWPPDPESPGSRRGLACDDASCRARS